MKAKGNPVSAEPLKKKPTQNRKPMLQYSYEMPKVLQPPAASSLDRRFGLVHLPVRP